MTNESKKQECSHCGLQLGTVRALMPDMVCKNGYHPECAAKRMGMEKPMIETGECEVIKSDESKEQEWFSAHYPVHHFDQLKQIIAESERRKVKEIREAILRLDCFDPVHDNKRDEILSLDCLKDE